MKGFVNFFVNFEEYDPDKIDAIMQIIKRENQEIWQLALKSDYPFMIQPTQNEASRIEKVDFDSPFPRFVSRNAIDINKLDSVSGLSVAPEGKDDDKKCEEKDEKCDKKIELKKVEPTKTEEVAEETEGDK